MTELSRKPLRFLLAGLGLVLAGHALSEPVQVTFTAVDDTTVYADYHARAGAPLILLFHQAGSNARGEYGYIGERLRRAGYGVLAVDLRSGGERFEHSNRTAAAFGDQDPGYCAPYADLQAAVSWARKTADGAPLVLWGSSYSAGLVLYHAAEHPEAQAAVLAFSPASGEPMDGCDFTTIIEQLRTPAVAFRPSAEMQYQFVIDQTDLLRGAEVPVRIIADAAHGSSMLVPGRGQADINDVWGRVNAFLSAQVMPPSTPVQITSSPFTLIGDMQKPVGQATAAPVLLLHGAGDQRHSYRQLALSLAQRGIASLRVDLRGHGDSIDGGRFVPSESASHALLEQATDDIQAAADWLQHPPGAIVSASYSTEAVMVSGALQGLDPQPLMVALSPGSLSEDSIAALDPQRWLLLRARRERNSIDQVFAAVTQAHPSARIIVTPGGGHGSSLLGNNPWSNEAVADFIAGSPGGNSP